MKLNHSFIRRAFNFLKSLNIPAPAVDSSREKQISTIETLEARIAPAFIVSVSGGLLKIVGDAGDNSITIKGDIGDPMKFTLTSAEEINGAVADFVANGVKNISIMMKDGNDSVTFDGTVPITLQGSLTVNGGDGANTVSAENMTIQKNLTIINGTNTAGKDYTYFVDSNIGGSVTIKNGNGNTEIGFYRTTAGISTIGGNFTVVNGAGTDWIYLIDYNFKRSINIKNGLANPDTNQAGFTEIYNEYNEMFPSVILGNVSVSYSNGNVDYDGIWDTEVFGNVAFNYGSATSKLYFDGYSTTLPVVIHGNLTVKGSGDNRVDIGTQYEKTGLIVGKKLTIQTTGGNDNIILDHLKVHGATNLLLGNGTNTININDSQFYGAFKLLTGTGQDTLSIETRNATAFLTNFHKPVLINLGAGDTDSYTLADNVDNQQGIVIWNKFKIINAELFAQVTSRIYFPFGNSIQTS